MTIAIDPLEELFGKVVYKYTRQQAIADGVLVDVSATAREAGFTIPAYMTSEVWDLYVTVPNGVLCQDEDGRLWDVLYMLRFAISTSRDGAGSSEIKFGVHIRNDNRHRSEPPLVMLKSVIGPTDIHDPAPAITIMLTTQD